MLAAAVFQGLSSGETIPVVRLLLLQLFSSISLQIREPPPLLQDILHAH